jgi:hydroxymethylbilane synthase
VSTLRLGTRASALALWQARHVAAAVARLPSAPAVEIVEIRTTGDAVTDIPLWKTAGKGFFTAELDCALLENKIDLAVHSLKDLPTAPMGGLTLTAVLEREDPRDALVLRRDEKPEALKHGATLGTSSLRRRAFAARWRPDLVHKDLRGNVPTRVARLDDGAYDAIILAAAGLKRLGLADRISTFLSTATVPHAVAQGAVAVVTRGDDPNTNTVIAPLNHAPTRISVEAERALLRHLEGGCQIPLGVHSQLNGTTLHLYAEVCALDGTFSVKADAQGPSSEPEKLGISIAEALLRRDARRALATMPPAAGQPGTP